MELFLRVVLVILWLPVDWSSSQKIEQNPQALSIQEGEEAILTCSYANYFPTSFQWYREDPGRGLSFLLLIRESERTKSTRRLKATFDTTNKQSSFYIINSQPADSATYFCASDTQQGLATHFLHPKPANHSHQQSCWLWCSPKDYCSSTGKTLYHWENNVVVICKG